MNELIKIEEAVISNEKVNAVSARELHKLLGVRSHYKDWIRNRLTKYDFQEGIDFCCLAKTLATQTEGGRSGSSTYTDHLITLDVAKELCMVENNAKGREARRYFIECEKQLRQALSAEDSLILGIIRADDIESRMLAMSDYRNTIVGRLRDSKYNASVTVIYNRHALQNSMSPREFADKLDKDELEAKTLVKDYEASLARYKDQGVGSSSLKALLASILKNPFIIVKGRSFDFEDMIADVAYNGKTFPEVEFYPHARVWFQQSYDLFTEHHYVMAKPLNDSDPRPLSSKAEEMKAMDEADAKMFQFKVTGLKSIFKLYEDNLEECLQKYPEWSDIIYRVGLDTCKALKYSKSKVRAYDQGLSLQQSAETERTVKRSFQVGQIYAIADIKKTLDKLGFEKPKGTMLSRWFHIKKTTKNGAVAYKILAHLDLN